MSVYYYNFCVPRMICNDHRFILYYTCLFLAAVIFVALLCTNVQAAVIFLYCCAVIGILITCTVSICCCCGTEKVHPESRHMDEQSAA